MKALTRNCVTFLAVALGGCASTPEITVLVGPRDSSRGDLEIAATIMVLQEFGEQSRGLCGWVHSSEVHHGVPFNDEPELVTDAAQCGMRFGGRRF